MILIKFVRYLILMALGVVAVTAVLMATTTAATQEPKDITQKAKDIFKTESVTVKATIEAIDKTNRVIKLKGPKGNVVEVKADEKVKRFDELNVGDVVEATYTESLAVHVRKPDEPVPAGERTVVKPSEGRPGSEVSYQKTVTVTVEDIDRTAPSVTVKDSEDNLHSFRVRDVKRLEGVNVGDKVDITYTIALLLKVERVQQAKR